MPTNYKGVNIEYIKDKDKLNIVLSYKDIKHKYSINPIYLDKYKATLRFLSSAIKNQYR